MTGDERAGRDVPDEHGTRLDAPDWWVYQGTGRPLQDIRLAEILPPPPPWRDFRGGPLPVDEDPPEDDGEAERRLGARFQLTAREVDPREADMVNAALFLRRPLLVTGPPGIGKSALPYRVARELRLGRVLKWPIVGHTTLRSGLYSYDAIGRAEAAGTHRAARWPYPAPSEPAPSTREPTSPRGNTSGPGLGTPGSEDPPIGDFVRLGPVGTALLPRRLPRVLLIDELDKSEPDLPNDLLNLFEDGEFTIPELERLRSRSPEVNVLTADPGSIAAIADGRVQCRAFPFIVITSNGEREFPSAFMRRCVRLELQQPGHERLAAMVAAHMLDPDDLHRDRLIQDFLERNIPSGGLSADKLLDAVYLATSGAYRADDASWPRLLDALWQRLTSAVI